MKYKVKVAPLAVGDIQEITNWYNDKQIGLGRRFQNTVIKQIDSLCKKPHVCSIRYKGIRCLLVSKFPYMVHFYINEETKTIEVLAVISTSRNPMIWRDKTENKDY